MTRDIGSAAAALRNTKAEILAVMREIAGISLDDGMEFDSERAVAEVIREEDEYSGIRVTLDGRLSRAAVRFHVDVNAESFLDRVLSPTLFVSRYREELAHICDVDETLDIYNTNIVDDHYTMAEGDFVPLLARALRGDISWYDSDDECIAFCQFITMQHLRTRRVKDRVVAKLNARMGRASDLGEIPEYVALLSRSGMLGLHDPLEVIMAMAEART